MLSDTNFYEVTIASVDQPKLLSRLSEALVSPGAAHVGVIASAHDGCMSSLILHLCELGTCACRAI